jgi:uncharacterized protein (UPF0262 family)
MNGSGKKQRGLVAVTLDEGSLGRVSSDQEHERAVAIWDVLESNAFAIPDHGGGPYALNIGLIDKKLALAVSTETGDRVVNHYLSLSPFRRIIKDYDLVCESYYAAIRTASPSQIEAIDMGRRGLHDEAATLLQERLEGKITIDFDTARRLFTLIFALHWKG